MWKWSWKNPKKRCYLLWCSYNLQRSFTRSSALYRLCKDKMRCLPTAIFSQFDQLMKRKKLGHLHVYSCILRYGWRIATYVCRYKLNKKCKCYFLQKINVIKLELICNFSYTQYLNLTIEDNNTIHKTLHKIMNGIGHTRDILVRCCNL